MHAYPNARMVGLDWGTSSLRAYLMGSDGEWLDRRERPWGIRALPEGGYAGALARILADWPERPLLAAGMVGSRQGWLETAYRELPVDESMLADDLVSIGDRKARGMRIVPGVRDPASGDVMRGEETQVLGALARVPQLAAEARLVLPGTHSKWVHVRQGAIARFNTLMTGELYAVLRDHSILGAGVPPSPDATAGHQDAFDAGVKTARDAGAAGILSRLFSARTRVLSGQLDAGQVPSFLSGLLIGEEWRIARASGWLDPGAPICLVGDAVLCQRYQRAVRQFGLPEPAVIEHAAGWGLWRLAVASRLICAGPPQPNGGQG